MGPKIEKHHHHILPYQAAIGVGVALLILTAVTVWVAHIDLGRFNFLIAMVVATTKAFLVALFFMNLLYDRKENGMIFVTSFVFLAIFIVLTSTDMFFRGDVYVKGPLAAASQVKSKLKKPWIATPELVARGKELFNVQCVACHGDRGEGNGPAAGALNPKPRNFHSGEGWVNGRKPTMVFKTLKEGIPGSGMASFATLPSDDRWALVHYVLSLGPQPVPADTAGDFAKVGINPNQEGGGATEAPTIPIALAMERIAVAEGQPHAHLEHPLMQEEEERSQPSKNLGAQLYDNNCASCHGVKGEGGIKVRVLGVNPVAFVTTAPFKGQASMQSEAAFAQVVNRGLPENIMPGFGDLSSSEMHEIYQYTKSLSSGR